MENTPAQVMKNEKGVRGKRTELSKINQAKRRKLRNKEKKGARKAVQALEAEQKTELSRVRRENHVLKGVLESTRKRLPNTNKTFKSTGLSYTTSRSTFGRTEAKKKLIEYFPSLPADLSPGCVRHVADTKYSGTFGSISVGMFLEGKVLVAQKKISQKKSSDDDIIAEVKIIHALSGHYLFPFCYGFIRPNLVIMTLLGSFENSILDV